MNRNWHQKGLVLGLLLASCCAVSSCSSTKCRTVHEIDSVPIADTLDRYIVAYNLGEPWGVRREHDGLDLGPGPINGSTYGAKLRDIERRQVGLVDPAGMRPATPREPARSLWSVALSRAVEALVEAGECPPNAPLPIVESDEPPSQPTILVLVTSRSIAIRGEADLPPPANA